MYGNTQKKYLRKNSGKALFPLFRGMLLYFINCILCLQPDEMTCLSFHVKFIGIRSIKAKDNQPLNESN